MNWEVILWTCITVGVLLAVCGIVIMIISATNMKKRRKEIGEVHTTLRVGNKILFAGGLYGRVVKISNDETIVHLRGCFLPVRINYIPGSVSVYDPLPSYPVG